MKKVFQLLNAMVRDGEVANYAIGGAIAAVFYVEPFSTQVREILHDIVMRHKLEKQWASFQNRDLE